MSAIVDMRGVLYPNAGSPIYASNYRFGDRGSASWQLSAGHFEGYLSPIITFPRPDSETGANARHRNCYTGQSYRIPVIQQGGAWPFYYELTTSPTGATIGNQLTVSGDKLVAGSDYGVITCPSLPAGTHSFTVRVTDQNLVVNTVSWTVVVGTSNWVVLDKSAGTNGSGTLASPFNVESSLSGQSSKCVLIRAGTIDSNAFSAGLNSFPRTWVPYSSEIVNWKVANVYCNSTHDLWLGGINIVLDSSGSAAQQWFLFDTSNRVTFFENLFNGANLENTNGAPSNSAVLFWANQHVALGNISNSFYSNIIGNEFRDLRDRDLVLGYSQQYKTIENNKLTNYQVGAHTLSHGFYEKTNCSSVTHRRNYSTSTTNTAKMSRWDAYAGDFPMDYFEASHNSYRFNGTIDYPITVGYETTDFGTHRYIYRNNFYSASTGCIGLTNTTNSGNLVTISRNVMMSPVTSNNSIVLDNYNGQYTNTNNVAGNLASGLLDSSNNLVSRLTPNLGTAGAEVK